MSDHRDSRMNLRLGRRFTRRDVLRMGAGAGATAALGLGRLSLGEAAKSKPNIVLCLADDLGWGDVGFHGHPRLKTPELDAMAGECAEFTRFFSAAPVCSPTRATCLTGRHHHRSGVTNHSEAINPDEPTVADALGDNGYRTGLFGKWHLHGSRGMRFRKSDAPFLPDRLGFQEWYATSNNADKVDPRFYWHNGEPALRPKGEDSQIIMDRALVFMREAVRQDKSFFACIWFHTPHTPYGSTDRYLEMYADVEDGETRNSTRRYYAQVTAMDEQMGRLRRTLREMGVAEDTLLVFTSDNGAKAPGSNAPLKGRKGHVSEGGTRVPCLIEWPSVVGKARKLDRPTVTTDFYHTFLAAAGIDAFGPDRRFDGESFLSALRGEARRRSEAIRFLHRGQGAAVTPDGEWTSVKDDPGYAAWRESVETDLRKSLDRIREIREKAGAG